MYAVVNTGGKQYKVQQGEVLRVEKIPGDVGSPVTFDRVLMFSDGENVSIGQPALEDILVEGHIVEQGKAKKIKKAIPGILIRRLNDHSMAKNISVTAISQIGVGKTMGLNS